MKKILRTALTTLPLLILLFFSFSFTVFAQGGDGNFVPLVGIPYLDDVNAEDDGGLGGYVNSLYLVAISIAAILAVLKIVISGVRYMLSEIVTDKSTAKKDIKNALLGLLVVIGAFLILDTINPNLTNLNVLQLEDIKGNLQPYEFGKGNSIAGTNEVFTDNETVQWIGFGRKIGSISECEGKNGRVIKGSEKIADRCVLPKRDFEGCANDETYKEDRLDNVKCVKPSDIIENLPTTVTSEAPSDERMALDYSKFQAGSIDTDLFAEGYVTVDNKTWIEMSPIEKKEYTSRLCTNSSKDPLRSLKDGEETRFYCYK